MDLASLIRTVPDFPKKGIMFKDITTLTKNADGFAQCMDVLDTFYKNADINLVAGVESRGFIFGSPLARDLHKGFIPIRKPGKLPAPYITEEYELEYGKGTLHLHKDAVEHGQKVLIVDDLIATGGTALASAKLVERLGGYVHGFAFIIDLPDLGGMKRIVAANYQAFCQLAFEGH